jgi:hypothetical protein
MTAILPGWIISGLGGGLAVPTITGLATIDLPSGSSATGSAALQMARQVGSVLGTAVLVAILGTAVTAGTVTAFLHAWWVCVACSYLAGCCADLVDYLRPEFLGQVVAHPLIGDEPCARDAGRRVPAAL